MRKLKGVELPPFHLRLHETGGFQNLGQSPGTYPHLYVAKYVMMTLENFSMLEEIIIMKAPRAKSDHLIIDNVNLLDIRISYIYKDRTFETDLAKSRYA